LRDPEASEPFADRELEVVLDGCEADPSEWIGPASKLLAYAGPHISVVSGGWRRETIRPPDAPAYFEWVYSPPLRSEAVRGEFIYWHRPKNEKPIGIELSRHLAGWLPTWLDQARPLSSRRYEQVLDRVGRTVHMQVNPLRFRHTCAVRMRRAGLSVQAICRRLGVTPETMMIYIEDPRWEATKMLRAAEW
jgi:integrase